MKYLIIVLLVLTVFSCKSRIINIAGVYKLNKNPAAKLTLYSDSTFEFVNIYKNPYLLPFEHRERFFITVGRWTVNNKRQLILNSKAPEENQNNKFQVDSVIRKDNKRLDFVFVDILKNIIPILVVEHKDSSITALFHHSMPSYSHDISVKDDLKFSFYGYDHFYFKTPEVSTGVEYKITIVPQFKKFFNKRVFALHKNRVVDKINKLEFQRYKSE